MSIEKEALHRIVAKFVGAANSSRDVCVRAGRWTEAVAPMGAPAKVLHDGDALESTRRAITMAAAQIKKAQA